MIPELAALPTLSNIDGSLIIGLAKPWTVDPSIQEYVGFVYYQNGPIKPQI